MKKTFITMCLTMLALQSPADDTNLVIYMANGSQQQTFGLSEIGKITFGDSGFTVNTQDGGATQFTFDAVKCIKLSEITTGINTTAISENCLKPYFRNGLLGVDGWQTGRKARATVCDIGGATVISVDNWDGTPINTSGLTDGVYIFNADNNTIKFVKQ